MRYNYTLFTNIDHVHIDAIRTHTCALLLESGPHPLHDSTERCFKARGFGTDPAWPVFDLLLPSVEYTLSDREGVGLVLSHDGSTYPLMSLVKLQVEDGPELLLMIEDYKKPLDIQTFEFEESAGIMEVWAMLKAKVAMHWNTPGMPRLVWGPPR